jgi:hypothetical protein
LSPSLKLDYPVDFRITLLPKQLTEKRKNIHQSHGKRTRAIATSRPMVTMALQAE